MSKAIIGIEEISSVSGVRNDVADLLDEQPLDLRPVTLCLESTPDTLHIHAPFDQLTAVEPSDQNGIALACLQSFDPAATFR
jgi:hypothetical protein